MRIVLVGAWHVGRALVDNLNFVSEPKVGAVVHMVKQLDYEESHPFRPTGTD